MKKKIAVFLAALLSVSVLCSVGCTKTKTASEQFQEAALSVGQYISDYISAGSILPDYSDAKGMETSVSVQLDQIEYDGEEMMSEDIIVKLHGIEDYTKNDSAYDGSLTIGEAEVPFVGYVKAAEEFLFALPEASEKYISVTGDEIGTQDIWSKLADALAGQINDESIAVESVEYEIDGEPTKGVTKLTFAPDEAQRKELLDAIDAIWQELMAEAEEEADEEASADSIDELTITFYVYRGATVAAEFVLADNDEDGGKLTGSLKMKNQDGTKFDAEAKLTYEDSETTIDVTLSAQQEVTDSGRTGTVKLAIAGDGMEIEVKADYQDEIAGQEVTGAASINFSVKQDGVTIGIEIPVNTKYTVEDNKVSGTFDLSFGVDAMKLALSGEYSTASLEEPKVTIPDVTVYEKVTLSDIEENTDTFVKWTEELADKYSNLFGEEDDEFVEIEDPDAIYPVFYLMKEDGSEWLDFYTDGTGIIWTDVVFEQENGSAVVTLDSEGSQIAFTYAPFGEDGYEMNQQIQIGEIVFDAVVSQDDITLTNEDIGWEFWFLPEEEYGSLSCVFVYEQTEDTVLMQLLSEETAWELTKSGEEQYTLGDAVYEYIDAGLYAD